MWAGRFASGLLVIVASSHFASANVEIGAIGGAHVFSDTSELGATDGPSAPSQRNSVLLGLRLGGFLADLIGIEAEFGVIPTQAREAGFKVTDITYRAHLVLELPRDPGAIAIPFILGGVGGFTVVSAKNEKFAKNPEKNIEPDTDTAFYAGAGVKLRLGASAGIRIDGRVLLMPSSENTIPADPDSRKQTLDFEALASVYVELGRETVRATTPRTPPPPDDGKPPDDAARCPAAGCDPDADGIVDSLDRCPADPEDKDGFQDDDGCPEADNDSDGIPDAQDKCPLVAEDKDGFQDDDGCPDPDNDGDGVPDQTDACLDQLETRNGFQDSDGCPDQLPASARILEGALAKVGFKEFAATFTPGATKQLDAVVLAMKANPDVRVAINVHTDDSIVTRGLYPDSQELSQGRAEAVMAYLVGKGIAADRLVAIGFGDSRPAVSPIGLRGAKLKAARARNRRVELHLVVEK